MKTINLKEIGIPDDVVFNSGGDEVVLNGHIYGDPDEIVVITQLGREVFSGTVCHISHGYETRNGNKRCDMIVDMPGFNKIIIPYDGHEEFCIKEFNGIKYTMACLAEKDLSASLVNWMY